MKRNLFLIIYLAIAMFVVATPFAHATIVSCTGLNCNVCHVFQTISNLVEFMLWSLALPATIIAFLYGGIMWTTAGDDPSKIEKGKKALRSALIGLIVAFAAWLIIDVIMQTLAGGSIPSWDTWNSWPGCAAGGVGDAGGGAGDAGGGGFDGGGGGGFGGGGAGGGF